MQYKIAAVTTAIIAAGLWFAGPPKSIVTSPPQNEVQASPTPAPVQAPTPGIAPGVGEFPIPKAPGTACVSCNGTGMFKNAYTGLPMTCVVCGGTGVAKPAISPTSQPAPAVVTPTAAGVFVSTNCAGGRCGAARGGPVRFVARRFAERRFRPLQRIFGRRR